MNGNNSLETIPLPAEQHERAMEVIPQEASLPQVQERLDDEDIQRHINLIQRVLEKRMVAGTHYGKIPGCGNKVSLLKPGAEMIATLFRLQVKPEVISSTHEKDYVDFTVEVKLSHLVTGKFIGSGVGSCNSEESQHKRASPRSQKNNILKKAKKRAFVDAILTCTAVSDMFTQDSSDDPDDGDRPDRPWERKQAGTPPERAAGGNRYRNLY